MHFLGFKISEEVQTRIQKKERKKNFRRQQTRVQAKDGLAAAS
jgi:hypothetical protein